MVLAISLLKSLSVSFGTSLRLPLELVRPVPPVPLDFPIALVDIFGYFGVPPFDVGFYVLPYSVGPVDDVNYPIKPPAAPVLNKPNLD